MRPQAVAHRRHDPSRPLALGTTPPRGHGGGGGRAGGEQRSSSGGGGGLVLQRGGRGALRGEVGEEEVEQLDVVVPHGVRVAGGVEREAHLEEEEAREARGDEAVGLPPVCVRLWCGVVTPTRGVEMS